MRRFLFALLFLLCARTSYADIYVVQSGDTLSAVLANTFTQQESAQIYSELKAKLGSFVLRAGTEVEVGRDYYLLPLGTNKAVRITKENAAPHVAVIEYETDILTTMVSGIIYANLFTTVKELGETEELAAQLARIYEWEFDFFKDIHPGDSFEALVEKRFVNGKFIGYGRILSANFSTRGKEHRAYYFATDGKYGYYDNAGRAMERGFLRVPLPYARITSRFSNSRMHPVLAVRRPHYGVDYAAPIGTPVMSTSAGVVVEKSYNKANGNYVHVRHANDYHTYYLHLNGFNKQVQVGSSVSQGQVIGYVGKTGYATGPHLDYRIQHRGKWLNPLTFIAESPKLAASQIPNFLANATNYDRVMNPPLYAGNNPVLLR